MLELHAHPQNISTDIKAFVAFEIHAGKVEVDFCVKSAQININQKFDAHSWSNWGLWEHDVVEVFIQRKNELNHYLELQVSPLNQKFALLIKKPREVFAEPKTLLTTISAHQSNDGFTAKFIIDLKDIPGYSNELRGNFHACLGNKNKRSFFSYKNFEMTKPDFHLPEKFQSLGVING